MGALGLKQLEPLEGSLSCSGLRGNLLECSDVLTAQQLESFCVGSGFHANLGYQVNISWRATTLPNYETDRGT